VGMMQRLSDWWHGRYPCGTCGEPTESYQCDGCRAQAKAAFEAEVKRMVAQADRERARLRERLHLRGSDDRL
jgi:hypothetical protein